ncbi:hypothetical protein F4802DRAFT_585252 [Xylaria palmicola]|nr:hypothetical protein F4802DRAFT_585252 [Xylaria palmicola]
MLKDDFVQTCRRIWPNLTKEEYLHRSYVGVLAYFESQARGIAGHSSDGGEVDYSAMLSIIDALASNCNALSTRGGCVAATRAQLPKSTPETVVMRCCERALRMILSLDIRLDSREGLVSRAGSSTVDWGDHMSLARAIENHFVSNGHHTRDAVTGRINPSLSVAHLCTYRGFKVFWTSNLCEHLSISWKSKIITIYEHKIVLWNHLRSSETPVIPRSILEEAIDTLNLLFPLNDRPTTTFLSQNGKDFRGVGYCSRPRDACLDLGKFNIWRGRVAELVEAMNEEPKGLRQLALEKDGRNFLPFVTFWVAISVALLSALSLPFAAISMLYTIKQYDLALAQACSDSNVRDALPQYCSPG